MRRTLQARAIKGSNIVEGYDVSLVDELAAVDAELYQKVRSEPSHRQGSNEGKLGWTKP
jgi:hypothetical protein